LEIDHIIVAVDDLGRAAERLFNDHGLAAAAGGRHPGHGTGNMIVPLAGVYIELMAVVDPVEAASSPLGRFVAEHVAAGGGPMALCLRTDDLAAVATERGVEPIPMVRRTPDGTELAWELAGLDRALGAQRLPFFIEWHVAPGRHPAETPVKHPGGAAALEKVVLRGDRDLIGTWLGRADGAIVVEPGPPGVEAIHLSVGGAPVVITRQP
jgi:hypothetical protein